MHRYYIIHKPYNVLSQFTSEDGKQTLRDYFDVPTDVYPVGRLDYDSEGLLLLTNDRQINHRLLNPSNKHEREYWVQVEGKVTGEALDQLQKGVTISVNGKLYHTKPCIVKVMDEPIDIYPRNPPIRFRKNIPETWMSIIVTEGKNRQVRKMTAKVGHPTLRLIRYRIGKITLSNLKPGEMKSCDRQSVYNGFFV